MLIASMYPPRSPHSPVDPFETVWNETSSTPDAYGSPIDRRTLLHDTNGRDARYEFSW